MVVTQVKKGIGGFETLSERTSIVKGVICGLNVDPQTS